MAGGDFEETFLTVAEVAELLRLNQQTVRNWIDAGTLPAVRVGRRVRIRRSDLNRILESGYMGTGSAASNIPGPSATDFWGGEPVGAAEPGATEAQPESGGSGGPGREGDGASPQDRSESEGT